jgi:DNA-binding NarL/FixJ family response regulator
VAEQAASIRLLRPVRVLVAGDDHGFVTRASSALLELGFDVMSVIRTDKVAEFAAVQRVNVVLLDVSGGLAAAAATASVLDALPQRIRVVLAGAEHRSVRRLGYAVIERQALPEELAAAVHQAYRGGPSGSRRSVRH